MKKVALFTAMVFILQALQAQVSVRVDNAVLNSAGSGFQVMGVMPVGNSEMVDLVKGSPFFNAAWVKSKVVTDKGNVYPDVPIKMNLYEHTVHYKDANGNEMVATTPLSEVLFENDAKGQRIHFINGTLLSAGKKGWYQLLVNDKITLVKGFKKFLETHTSYNTSKQYSINTTENYIVFYKGKEYEVKKPIDLVNIWPDKKAEIESHIKKNNKLSKEQQFVAAVSYANTIIQ